MSRQMLMSDEEEEIYNSETENLIMSTMKEDSNLVSNPPAAHDKTMVNGSPHSNGATIQSNGDNKPGTDRPRRTDDVPTTPYIWMISAFAAIGGFLFGYDTGVVSGAMLLLKDEFSLSSYMQEIIVSSTIGAAFIFALLGGVLNDLLGRKIVTIIASFVFTVGAVVLAVAQGVVLLIVGRFILGIGIGKFSFLVLVPDCVYSTLLSLHRLNMND